MDTDEPDASDPESRRVREVRAAWRALIRLLAAEVRRRLEREPGRAGTSAEPPTGGGRDRAPRRPRRVSPPRS